MQRLADKHRAPFVLCCLEGLTKAEAARELGWKEGTVSWRLAQARELLQKRLTKRGVTLTSILTVLALTPQKGAVSAALIQATIQGVLAALVNKAAVTLSPAAVALTNAMIHSMATAKVKAGLAVLLMLTVLTGGASLAAYRLKSDTPRAVRPRARIVSGETQPVETQLVGPPGKAGPGPGPVRSHALSPAGKRLVSTTGRANQPGNLKVRDTATGAEIVAIPTPRGPSAIAFSPDGRLLAEGDFGGDITLRDANTGREQSVLKSRPSTVHGLAFSPDGSTLASGSEDGTLTLWDLNNRQAPHVIEGHTGTVFALAFFHDGQFLASGSEDATVKVWNARTRAEIFTLPGHEKRIDALAVSPDDRFIASASADRTLRLWDAKTGMETARFKGQPGVPCSVAFSPNGHLLASGDMGGTVCLWDVKTRQLLSRLEKQTAPIWALAFSDDGQWLRTGNALGSVRYAVGFLDLSSDNCFSHSATIRIPGRPYSGQRADDN